jgi:hypothetical protein
MSNLATFSTINEKAKKYLYDYSLDDISTAFDWLSLETILNLNEDEIEDALTDGSMDGGIDAIHIQVLSKRHLRVETARYYLGRSAK